MEFEDRYRLGHSQYQHVQRGARARRKTIKARANECKVLEAIADASAQDLSNFAGWFCATVILKDEEVLTNLSIGPAVGWTDRRIRVALPPETNLTSWKTMVQIQGLEGHYPDGTFLHIPYTCIKEIQIYAI